MPAGLSLSLINNIPKLIVVCDGQLFLHGRDCF